MATINGTAGNNSLNGTPTADGADTLVQLDKDGSGGGAAAVTVATVVGAPIAGTDFDYGVV
jgi:hypothetical protein